MTLTLGSGLEAVEVGLQVGPPPTEAAAGPPIIDELMGSTKWGPKGNPEIRGWRKFEMGNNNQE